MGNTMVGAEKGMKMSIIVLAIKVVYLPRLGAQQSKTVNAFTNPDCLLKMLDDDKDRVFVLELI